MSARIRNAVALLRHYALRTLQLPEARKYMFVAGSPPGRWFKMALFSFGIFLPLGSLIWAVLIWHGIRTGGTERTNEGGRVDPSAAAQLTIDVPAAT